jgi:hypothetical protein
MYIEVNEYKDLHYSVSSTIAVWNCICDVNELTICNLFQHHKIPLLTGNVNIFIGLVHNMY